MKDVNKIFIMGRLGADPVSRETKAGVRVVNFPVATSRRLRAVENPVSEVEEEDHGLGRDESKEAVRNEETQWHRIVAWGKQGENCSQYLRKGDGVFIEGSVRTRKFQLQDGTDRFTFEVHAESVSFLGRANRMVERTPMAAS